MATMDLIPSKCLNKLCTYEGRASVINGVVLTENRVCPVCGFKTLSVGATLKREDPVVKAIKAVVASALQSHD